ncbi:MAG: C39 family peptidase [Patescibacteria group bacterium]
MMKLNKLAVLISIISFVLAPTVLAAGVFAVSSVPFTSQAPLAEWRDQRQQDGCEEAVSLMAMWLVKSQAAPTKAEAKKQLLAISDFEKKKYGEYRDVALSDMITWIFKDYFKYEKVRLVKDLKLSDLKSELAAGHVLLLPMNGQRLKNPYFTAPGPERHMILVYGYDPAKKEFITNDPGTRRGAAYRYPEKILFDAIRAYPTGYHKAIKKLEKAMIVVELAKDK